MNTRPAENRRLAALYECQYSVAGGYPMWTARSEINHMLKELGPAAAGVRELPVAEASTLLRRIEEQFLDYPGVLFWWDHFSQDYEGYNPPDGDGSSLIPQLTPSPDESAWLVGGLTDRDKAVYECPPVIVPSILAGCAGFEYAVVATDLSWLVLENHHQCMFAVGPVVMERLRTVRG